MKNIQTFALGMLSGILVIACGGSADSGAAAGPQTVKIDSAQLQQLVGASGGADGKWEFQQSDFKNLPKFGEQGWSIATSARDTKNNLLFVMQRPKK